MTFIITIDGPAGSGKTTTAKGSAEKLGMIYLDTGAMYRAAALYMIKNNIDVMNENIVKEHLININITFDKDRNIFLNNENVSKEIRNEEISQAASKISTLKCVRDFLVSLQRDIGNKCDIVAEGRDMGTVVFPNAALKFYIECSIDERAKRRYNEYLKNRIDVEIDNIKDEIEIRDNRDKTRKYAPLRMAENAILIDTTKLSKEDQIKFVIEKAKTVRKDLHFSS